MNLDYTSDYEYGINSELTFEKDDNSKKNYVIIYKANGTNRIILGEDLFKNEVKELFAKIFPKGEIIEMYSYREWTDKVGEEFAKKAIGEFSKLERIAGND